MTANWKVFILNFMKILHNRQWRQLHTYLLHAKHQSMSRSAFNLAFRQGSKIIINLTIFVELRSVGVQENFQLYSIQICCVRSIQRERCSFILFKLHRNNSYNFRLAVNLVKNCKIAKLGIHTSFWKTLEFEILAMFGYFWRPFSFSFVFGSDRW